MPDYQEKVGLVQRVLPSYRVNLFNLLGKACRNGLSVFAGQPRRNEMIKPVKKLDYADLVYGQNLHVLWGKFYLCIQFGLLIWLKTWNPDVLIVEANPRYLKLPAAIRWMHQLKRPVIGWGLGAPPISGMLASTRLRRRKDLIQQFDALITYSQSGAEEYRALGYPQDRIFIAHNAVTRSPDHPMPERPPILPTNAKPQILFVGRLQERKNVDNLIHACARLPESSQPKLLIVGDGPGRKQLELLAKVVYPKAEFTGALYDEALRDQFLNSDLFVLPGTGGLAIQQAMSYGLPVIAAQADGTQADLIREANGWQIPANDIQSLQATLERALSDIPALRRMGAESYRIVAEEINLEKMIEVFIKALERSMA